MNLEIETQYFALSDLISILAGNAIRTIFKWAICYIALTNPHHDISRKKCHDET